MALPLTLMQVPRHDEPTRVQLTVVQPKPLPEKCCTVCQYRPRTIRKALVAISLILSGGDAAGLIGSILDPCQGYDRDHEGGGSAGGSESRWGIYVADMQRAWAAGKRTPEDIAAYLCCYSGDDEA